MSGEGKQMSLFALNRIGSGSGALYDLKLPLTRGEKWD